MEKISKSFSHIAVLVAGGIGDGLMFTPALRLLKETYPHLKIDVICRKAGVKGIFENNPLVNQVSSLEISDVSIWKLVKQVPFVLKQIFSLRKKVYDAVVVSFPAYRREYSVLAFLLKSSFRIGHRYRNGFFSQFHWLYHHQEWVDESQHNVINNLNLLRVLGIDWQTKKNVQSLCYDLFLSNESSQKAELLLKNEPEKKWIGLHPGSTGSPIALMKRWPTERWCELTQKLVNQNYAVWIFGGKGEEDIARTIQSSVKGSVYSSAQLSFNQAATLVTKMKLMITVDNGFGHVAAALNCPLISLWGFTNPTWCRPWNPGKVKVIRKARWEPWFRYEFKTEAPKGLKSGMEEITTEDVISAIQDFMYNLE
ncbi:MAG: glycosyltransferase family 9 protein [Verrucomicrobiae bacterium]|nr:glycosyltransferase family 9 protein [Verrucomicrobiae bacterium]